MKSYQAPKFSSRALLEIFPEAKEIIPEKIREWQETVDRKEKEIRDLLQSFSKMNLNEFDEWMADEAIKVFLIPELIECEKHIFRLKRLLALSDPNNRKISGYQDFQEKIEKAREYPIVELAQSHMELKASGNRFISLCPFHNEKTPSFFIYPETNTFHCFGCQESGDVIKLTMALCGVEFKDAIEMLQN